MQPTIGDNIARLRRRNAVTQEALAERAGISVETIRKLEQNDRTTARVATINAIARALDTTTSALIGNAAAGAARREADYDQVALLALRSVLTPARGLHKLADRPHIEPRLTPEDLHQRIHRADDAYHRDDYTEALVTLPDLLNHAEAAAAAAPNHQRRETATLLSAAHQLAGTALIQLRSFDLAYQALNRALDAADSADDDLLGASVVVTLCWLLLRQGRLAEVERLAVRTADEIEPRFSSLDPPRLATWGWLLLRAAAAAVRDGRADDAEDLLDAASAAAARIGTRPASEDLLSPGPVSLGAFCARTVAMKRVETVTLAGDPGRAITLAEQIPPGRVTSNNYNRFRLDVANAYAMQGAYADAAAVLTQISRDAPSWLRHQRYARDIVGLVTAAKRRAFSRELAELTQLIDADI